MVSLKPVNINLEDRYNTRKGIYVLTYSGKAPYKIGMTNSQIGKRIGSYVNCPSQSDGHYMHLLLTWDIRNELKAGNVERWIFRRLEEEQKEVKQQGFRLNSTQRKRAFKTEHFDVSLDKIKQVFEEARLYYMKEYKGTKMYVDMPEKKTVKYTEVIKGKNILKATNTRPR